MFNLRALPVPMLSQVFFGGFLGLLGVSFSEVFFGAVSGARWVPQNRPKSTPRPPKMPPRGVPRPFLKRVPKKVNFLVVLGLPGTPKIELPRKRELNFHFFSFPPFWSQNGSKNGTNMEPKWLPNSLGGRLGGFQEPSQKSFKK